jgi:DNA-binding response OmpR family regulator
MKVLYLEDEKVLGRIVKESLESRGCTIDWFVDATAAAAALKRAADYDIAVLDVQLPGEDGFRIGSRLRQAFPALPILYLTARVTGKDAVTGFSAGGNDYVRKPFSMEELLIRMKRLAGVSPPTSSAPAFAHETFSFGSFTFDYRSLDLNGQTLSHREGELLRYLLLHRNRDVIDRRELLLALWGDDGFFHSRNLDVYIRKLRKRLERVPEIQILTLRGVGYRLLVPDN